MMIQFWTLVDVPNLGNILAKHITCHLMTPKNAHAALQVKLSQGR